MNPIKDFQRLIPSFGDPVYLRQVGIGGYFNRLTLPDTGGLLVKILGPLVPGVGQLLITLSLEMFRYPPGGPGLPGRPQP